MTPSGTATLLHIAQAVSTGTWYTLRFEAFGSALRGYLNGSLVVSATDTTFATGRIGLTTVFSTASFDDVAVADVPGPGPTITPGPTTSAPPTSRPPTSQPPTSQPPPAHRSPARRTASRA